LDFKDSHGGMRHAACGMRHAACGSQQSRHLRIRLPDRGPWQGSFVGFSPVGVMGLLARHRDVLWLAGTRMPR
jgi:hypothetical protein